MGSSFCSMSFGYFGDVARRLGIVAFDLREVTGKELGGDDAHKRGQPFGDVRREFDRRLREGEGVLVIRDDNEFGVLLITEACEHVFH